MLYKTREKTPEEIVLGISAHYRQVADWQRWHYTHPRHEPHVNWDSPILKQAQELLEKRGRSFLYGVAKTILPDKFFNKEFISIRCESRIEQVVCYRTLEAMGLRADRHEDGKEYYPKHEFRNPPPPVREGCFYTGGYLHK